MNAEDEAKLAKAIADSAAKVPMVGRSVALMGNPQRPAQIAVPADVTDLELLGLVAQVLIMGDQIRAERAQRTGPRLVLPS